MIAPYALLALLIASGACQSTTSTIKGKVIEVVVCPVRVTRQPTEAEPSPDEPREELAPVDPPLRKTKLPPG